MARRIIAIPLAVAIAIAVFLLPVVALTLPENNVDGSYSIDVSVTFSNSVSGAGPYSIPLTTLNYGQYFLENMKFRKTDSSANIGTDIVQDLSFSINVSAHNTMYIMVPTGSINGNNLSYSSLSPYYSSTGSYSVSESISTPNTTYFLTSDYSSISSRVVDATVSDTWGLTFLCFRDVPAGTYSLTDDRIFTSTVSGFTYAYAYAALGVFIQTEYNPSTVVDDYIDGKIPFDDALTDLNTAFQAGLQNANSDLDRLFEVTRADYELDRLVNNSNNKNVQTVQQNVIPAFDNQLDSYVSGSLTLEQTISNLHDDYTAALNAAETPEQGTFINTTYSITLEKLELEARQKAYERLDSAITDEQITEADEYYQSEEELINMFEVAEFESALDFQIWLDALPLTEATEYKKFFDYILNDSSIRMFLVIPISLVLVRVLLGTALQLVGTRSTIDYMERSRLEKKWGGYNHR